MKEKQTLTEKQKDILQFIYTTTRECQLPPSIREIAQNFGFTSTATVRDHLKALVKKGYIKIAEGKSRAIEIIKQAVFQVPVIGKVRAGMPIFALEDLEGYLDLSDVIFPDKNIYALRVKGDSMKDAGIMPDDFVLVHPQEMAAVGEIVIAMVGEEATVKRLVKRGGQYFLDPANPNYEPISVTSQVTIIGKVIHVVRKY